MPTAKFQADFSDFLNKTREASGSLERLADAAGSTSGSLSKVGSSFTGEALIRKAVDTAAAIEKIGGASALTEREMVRVNATVTEAISKLGVLGAKAPKELTDLAAATHTAADKSGMLERGFSFATVAVGNFAANLATQAISTLREFAVAAFDGAGKILDLSDQTGLSVESIQKMQYAAALTGTEIEKFTTAAFNLGINLAGGGGSVNSALKEIGLTTSQIDLMSVDEQFTAIADKLHDVTDAQERNRLGAELFGAKVWKEIAPAVVQGYRQMTDELDTAAREQLDAIDSLSDRWDGFKVQLGVITEKIIAGTISMFQLMVSEMQKASLAQAGQYDMLRQLIDQEKKAADAARAHGEAKSEQTKQSKNYVDELKAVKAASDALSPSVVAQILAARELGESTKDVARELRLSEDVIASVQKAHNDAAKKTKEHSDEIAKLADKYGANGLTKDALDLVQALKQITDMSKLSSDQQAKLAKDVIELGDQYRALGKDVPAHIQALIDQSMRLVVIPEMLKKGNEEARKEFERITKEFVDSTSKLSDEASKQSLKTLGDALNAGQKVSEEFDKATLTSFELAVKHAEKWRDDTLKAIEPLKTSFPALYAELGAQVQTVYAKMVEDAQTSASEQLSGFSKIFGDLPGVIAKAIQGGGSIKAAIMNSVGGNLFDPQDGALGKMLAGGVNKLANSLQSSLGQGLAGKIGQGLFSLIPMVGSLMGPLTSVIGAGLSKLFGGVSKEVRQAREEIASMEKQLASTLTASQQLEAGNERWKMTTIAVRDAYLATGRSAADAEAIVRQLWDDSKPQKVKEAIEQINAVMDEQKAAQDALNAAIERYGFKIEELGPALQRQKLSEMVQQLMKDFALLTAAGVDVNLVTERMSGSINEYVRLALRTGQEVPASMKPILEKMIEMGLLTDENGEKITDLSKIPFSETMTQGFDRVVGAIDRLIQAITGGLDKAADEIVDFTDTVGDAVNNLPDGYTLRVNLTAGDTSGLTTAVSSAVAQSVASAAGVLQKLGLTWSGIGGSGGGSGDGGPSTGQQITLAEFLRRNGLQDINRFIDANTNKDLWGENITDPELLAAARNKADNEARQFKKDNPELFNPDGTPKKFAMGTKGATGRWFNNFGVGTPAILHGDEAVVRKDQAGEFAATFGSDSGVLDELANIRTSLSALPQHIARAVRDAVLVAG